MFATRLPSEQICQAHGVKNMGLLRSLARVAIATTAYFAVHSLMASRTVKRKVEARFGTRTRNALYRPLYNAQAIGGLIALTVYIRRQPNVTLYEIKGTPGLFLRTAQVLLTMEAAATAHQVGILRFSGLPALMLWLTGKPEIPREPEGQGPGLNADGSLRITGAFRNVRHPLNGLVVVIFALSPRMTTNWAAVCGICAAYCVLGSRHEEIRLRERYGERYADYQRSAVPFFIPRLCPAPPPASEN